MVSKPFTFLLFNNKNGVFVSCKLSWPLNKSKIQCKTKDKSCKKTDFDLTVLFVNTDYNYYNELKAQKRTEFFYFIHKNTQTSQLRHTKVKLNRDKECKNVSLHLRSSHTLSKASNMMMLFPLITFTRETTKQTIRSIQDSDIKQDKQYKVLITTI